MVPAWTGNYFWVDFQVKYLQTFQSYKKRLGSACEIDGRSTKRSQRLLCVCFTRKELKTRVIRLRVIEGSNAHDQIAFFSFRSLLVESPNERWLHTYRACVIVTMRSGLRAPLIASNRQNLGLTQNNKVSFLRNTRTTGQNEGERSLRFYSVGDCLPCSYYVGRKQYRLDRISRLCQVIQCGRGKSSLCASCRRISRLFSLSTEQQRKRVHCWQSTMITQNL